MTITQTRPVCFPLGRILATPGALAALDGAGVTPRDLLRRHARGDWGDIHPEDVGVNEWALCHGARLLSCYHAGDERIWCITEADRAATTFLLPSEY